MPAQFLAKESGTVIQSLIQHRFEEDDIRTHFPNPLLREDALALLNKYCICGFRAYLQLICTQLA